MKYRIVFLLIFLVSCSSGTLQNKKSTFIPYSSKGFVLIYNENDYEKTCDHVGGLLICPLYFASRSEPEVRSRSNRYSDGRQVVAQAGRARLCDLLEAGDAHPRFEGRRKDLEANLSRNPLTGRRWVAWQLRGLRHGIHRGCDRCFLRLGNAGNLHWLGRWHYLVTPQQGTRQARKCLGSDRWQGRHADGRRPMAGDHELK